jgi:hypothetical protein
MADHPPPDPDVPVGTRLVESAYQVVALLSMLAHLLIVGPLCLLTLGLTVPPGADLGGFMLKAIVVLVWFGMGYVGIKAWDRKSWWVVAVPIIALVLVVGVILTGNDMVGWYLNIGY